MSSDDDDNSKKMKTTMTSMEIMLTEIDGLKNQGSHYFQKVIQTYKPQWIYFFLKNISIQYISFVIIKYYIFI